MVYQMTCTHCGQRKKILTQRQVEVAQQLVAHPDASNEELAARLCISRNTLESHLREMYCRLDVHTRLGFVLACQSLGLLADPPEAGEGRQKGLDNNDYIV